MEGITQDGETLVKAANGVVLEGWVYKQGDWRNPAFQKRWFVLRQHQDRERGMILTYFTSKDSATTDSFSSKGSLICQGMTVENIGEIRSSTLGKALECFAITSREGISIRRMVCGCETRRERRQWVNSLVAAASAIQSDDNNVCNMRMSCRFRLGGVLLLRKCLNGKCEDEEDEDLDQQDMPHNDVCDVVMKVISHLACCIQRPAPLCGVFASNSVAMYQHTASHFTSRACAQNSEQWGCSRR